MMHQKKYEFFTAFWSKKMRFWMCWSHWNALNKGISVVLAYYDKTMNFMRIPCQNGHQNWGQNRGLGDQGSDFWGFGKVFEESDFWWVFDRRKVGLKSTKIATWSGQKGVWTKGRRDEAVPAEAFGVWQELAGVCSKHPERPAPRKGGGGFKG